MQVFSVLVAIGTMVLGLVLGVALLRLAARTREIPELAMGLYCLLVTLCALLFWFAYRFFPAESPWVMPLSAAASLALGAAAFALAVGIWRIFRPGSRWARVAVALVGAELLGSWIATVARGEPVHLSDATLANGFFMAGRVAVYFFGGFEAIRHAIMLRRRAALGLADPVSAHQILLWGVAWLSLATLAILSVVLAHGMGRSIYEHPWIALLGSTLNVIAWMSTWFSFFPPAFYQRLVAPRAEEATP